jgi:hypothetical protein
MSAAKSTDGAEVAGFGPVDEMGSVSSTCLARR